MTEDVYERFYKADTKEKLISLLKILYEKGYRYVIKRIDEKWLTAFEFKPVYHSHGFWGYSDRDLPKIKLIAYPIETHLTVEAYKPRLISDILWPNQTIEEPEVKDQLTLF